MPSYSCASSVECVACSSQSEGSSLSGVSPSVKQGGIEGLDQNPNNPRQHSMYVFKTTVPLTARILAVVSEGYTTRETCAVLPTSALSQLEARWPNILARTKLHRLTANWIGHLYINLPLGSNVPDGARLDVPNKQGKFLTVDLHGRLEEDKHETIMTSWSTAATEPPLPNAQYQSYPMIINHLNRPCVLHAPWWDTIAGPKPGQFYPLTQNEYKKRKRLREQALHDLDEYGSPEWLAREPEGWDAWEYSEELPW
ncbi:MAG: hypothetical protein Q9193_003051 [Seirophora villosa]